MTRNPTNTAKNLRLGIEAARAGQKEKARTYLTKVLEQEPNNIPAMFWLAYVAPSPQESIDWLERVLALDPENDRAKAGIRWAREQLGPEEAAKRESSVEQAKTTPAQAAEKSPELPDEFIRQQLLSQKESQKRAQKGALAHRARRTIDPLLTLVIILGAVVILTVDIWILALTPADTLAAWLPAPVENALVSPEPAAVVSEVELALAESPAESVASIEHFASDSDTLIIAVPQPVETGLTEPETSTPLPEPEPNKPEPDELITLAEESSALVSPIGELDEFTPVLPVEENRIGIEPDQFVGPAELFLTGPRLFQPVDEKLLAHQLAFPGEKWIEVDVTEQRVTAWEGNVPVMSFLTSTGLPNTPTVLGEFNIYWKLESTLMTGPGYYLPEVPYTMYFYAGYALHGAYWHDNFGNPMSHGCVNLSIDNSKELFEWADPVIPPNQTQVVSSADNPGTLVVVHE